MKKFWLLFLMLLLVGCGGGGGGGSVHISGLVLWLANSTGPTPAATVQVGSAATTTAADGFFLLTVPAGTTSCTVIYTPTVGTPVTFTFSFPPVSGDTDLGDLIVGPEKISVSGKVVSTSDGSAIAGASVVLGGKQALTDSLGNYLLTEVAYDSGATNAFLSLVGRAGKSGFFTRAFSPDGLPVGGVASISDIALQPDSGTEPPDTPYVILGSVGPSALATGSVVDLYQGTLLVRRYNVGTDHKYGFWVPVGTYIIRAYKPSTALTAPDITVTLTSPTQVAKRDVTLN